MIESYKFDIMNFSQPTRNENMKLKFDIQQDKIQKQADEIFTRLCKFKKDQDVYIIEKGEKLKGIILNGDITLTKDEKYKMSYDIQVGPIVFNRFEEEIEFVKYKKKKLNV